MGIFDDPKAIEKLNAIKAARLKTEPTPSTQATEVKTTTSPTAKPVEKNPAVNKFEDTYGDMVRGNDVLTKQWNYNTNVDTGGTRHYIKAINGRYDSAINNEGVDQETRNNLKAFKENALKAANIVKTGIRTDADNKAYYDARKNADSYWKKANDALSSNKDYAIDKNLRFTTTYNAKVADTEVTNMPGTNTDASHKRNGDELERIDSPKGYNKIEAFEIGFRNTLEKQTKPYVKEWLDNGFNMLNDESNKTNRANMWQMTTDLLKHADKYGTKANGAAGKAEARAVLEKIWKAKDFNSKMEVIKANRDAIQSIHDDTGYYGNAHLFDKYSKNENIALNKSYYSSGNIYNGKDRDQLISAIPRWTEYNKKFSDFKEVNDDSHKKAITQIAYDDAFKAKVNHSDLALKNLVDARGNVTSFKKWAAGLESSLTEIPVGSTFAGGNFNQVVVKNGKWYLSDANKLGAANIANGGFTFDNKIDTLKKVYNNAVYAYKSKHDKIIHENESKYSAIKVGVNGDTVYDNIGYEHVDLTMDKNFNFKNASNIKQQNVSNILKMVRGENNAWDTENVAIFMGNEHQEIDAEDFKNRARNNAGMFQKVFKPGTNMNDYTLTFERGTGVQGASAYVFQSIKNPDDKFSIVANKQAMSEAKEYFHKETQSTSDDYLYGRQGYKSIPVDSSLAKKEGIVKATIKDIDGYKKLVILNDDNQQTILPLGPSSGLSINQAEVIAKRNLELLKH